MYVTPNICYVDETSGIVTKPYVTPQTLASLSDIAYWDGSEVKTTPYSKWNSSLGTPVGVVVIPSGFAPDGYPRIIGLNPVDKSGNTMKWGGEGTDTNLTNFTKVTDTINSNFDIICNRNDYGYLPSDKFTGATSYVDSKAKYNGNTPYIPSPYLNDRPNPEYYKEISGGNALSDFNGLSNTKVLVKLGSDYTAANAAYKYNDGVSNLQWYLPAMGELGFIMPRFNEINNIITSLGGVAVDGSSYFWSSSEYSNRYSYYLYTNNGAVSYYYHDRSEYNYVRPFSILEKYYSPFNPPSLDTENLITFTVDGVEYYAKKGATWADWWNGFNIGGISITDESGNYVYFLDGSINEIISTGHYNHLVGNGGGSND